MTFVRRQLEHRVFGRLTVVSFAGRRAESGNRFSATWKCLCVCGNFVIISTRVLNSGRSRSCGCLHNEQLVARSKKHGDAKRGNRSSEYTAWLRMKSRCYNKNTVNYADYGGRGIKVCERWLNSYVDFISDMGRKPAPSLTLERMNNSGNYEPVNCKWATRKEQRRNQRARVYRHKKYWKAKQQ